MIKKINKKVKYIDKINGEKKIDKLNKWNRKHGKSQ